MIIYKIINYDIYYKLMIIIVTINTLIIIIKDQNVEGLSEEAALKLMKDKSGLG